METELVHIDLFPWEETTFKMIDYHNDFLSLFTSDHDILIISFDYEW